MFILADIQEFADLEKPVEVMEKASR